MRLNKTEKIIRYGGKDEKRKVNNSSFYNRRDYGVLTRHNLFKVPIWN